MDIGKYKWLLFDFDNTLVDFHSASVQSFSDLAGEIGLEYTQELYHSYTLHNNKVWGMYEKGTIDSQTLRRLRFEYFFEEQQIAFDAAVAHEHYISGLIKYTVPDAEVTTVLDDLASRHSMAIITNGLREAQRPRLVNSQLRHYFEEVIVSDEIGLAKPDQAYFQHSLAQIGGVPPDQCLIIGDSLGSDILGGMNSGIDTVWYNPKRLHPHSKIEPTHTIHALQSLCND